MYNTRRILSSEKSYVDGIVLCASLSIIGLTFLAAVSDVPLMKKAENDLDASRGLQQVNCLISDSRISCHGEGISINLDLE